MPQVITVQQRSSVTVQAVLFGTTYLKFADKLFALRVQSLAELLEKGL